CAGFLCQLNLDPRLFSTSLGATYSSVVPFFVYLMIRLHNQVTFGTHTKYNVKSRNQTLLMTAILVLLLGNTICFGLFVVDGDNKPLIKEVSKSISIFKKVALLFFTCFFVVILLIFLTTHSLYIIANRDVFFLLRYFSCRSCHC
ncbi:hypothetical protein PENTCL1PPCAC_423, partial [Pristionchus entomophagus]